ncbi:MAG: hypothetical protein AAGA20_09865 [Planctomycetota bacterium]
MPEDEEAPVKSYGNMSEHHWSRTRGERNAEAIDYYRERSQAPGVAEGGDARNFYCMECDGVVPWDDFSGDACPHCGAAIDGNARRYFNWVEIDRAPDRDRTAVLLAVGIVGLALLAFGGLVALFIT